MTFQKPGIILAEGHPVTLKGLQQLIIEESPFQILATCADANTTLQALSKHQPDILLLDLDLPGKCALKLLAELIQAGHIIKVVVIAIHIDEHRLREAIRLGVRGMLLKSMPTCLLLQCLLKVLEGGEWLERQAVQSTLETMLRRELTNKTLNALTSRDLQLATLASKGFSNKEIAKQVNITEGSVKISLSRIYKKLNCKNRVGLTALLQQK